MTSFTKLLNSIVFSIIINLSIAAMETVVTKENPTPVTCVMMITDVPMGANNAKMTYATKKYHDAIFDIHNLQSTIKDPVIQVDITELSTNITYLSVIPAKYCMNLSNRSKLKLFEKNEDTQFEGTPLEKKPLLLNIVCIENPQLSGRSFAEQFNNIKRAFYANPTYLLGDAAELINTSVITRVKKLIPQRSNIYGTVFIEETIFSHGPNGCPDDKTLLKSISQ